MADSFRMATFNAENLFARARVFSCDTRKEGDLMLASVDELRQELDKEIYDKPRILELYNGLKDFIQINEVRGKLFKYDFRFEITGVKANGKGDWHGFITFITEKLSEITIKNTAMVINAVKADIISLIEVEDKFTLDEFNSDLVTKKYPYSILIDAFDPRGIDCSVLSRFELDCIRTHMFEKKGRSRIFSRDCLDLKIKLAADDYIYLFVNHFKSQGYGSPKENDARRLGQSARVAEIITERELNLSKDKVVVLGDFNAPDGHASLSPLLDMKGLKDVLSIKIANGEDRWTYHYNKNQQIDFILVSVPLQEACISAGVERRGIYDVHKYSQGAIQAWPEIQDNGPISSASDHGAVWADFKLS